MKIIKNLIKYLTVFAFIFSLAFNASAQVWTNDIQVLKVAKSGEFSSTNSVNEYVSNGDTVSVQVYYRPGTSMSDAVVKLSGGTGGSSNTQTITGGVYSSAGNSIGQVNISSSTPFTLNPIGAMWFRNNGTGNRTQSDISGSAIQIANGSGMSLGALNSNLNTQGAIVVKYQVIGQAVNPAPYYPPYNPQPTVYQCNDGLDNDGDGMRDAQDPDCHSDRNTSNYNSYVITYPENTYNYNTPTTSAPSVITNPATNVYETSARLNSVATSNGIDSATWYEWGPTVNMTNRTNSQSIGLGNSVAVSDGVSGLNLGTVYFYRAVVRNNQGVVRYGGVESFKTLGTPVVVQPTVRTVVRTVYRTVAPAPTAPQINLVANNLVPGLVALRVTDTSSNNLNNVNACVGDEFNYEIVYQNVSGKTLTNSVLEVKIPTELDYVRSTNGGTYSNNNRSLVYNLGTLNPNQGGTLNVTVKASNLARGKGSVVTSLSLSYTNPDTLAQEEAIAYVIHNFGDCTNNNGALAFFGTTFLPTTLAGWLLLIILILALMLLARTVYDRTRKTGTRTTYQTTQETHL
jgi:hypothetical protein